MNIKAPPKVKNFIWRVCRNVFLHRIWLRELDVEYPHAVHLMWRFWRGLHKPIFSVPQRCYGLAGVWSLGQIARFAVRFCSDSAKPVHKLSVYSFSSERSVFWGVMWSIWQQRSKRVWDNVQETHTQVFTQGRQLLLNWQLMQKPANEANTRSGADSRLQAAIRWKKPLF